MSKLILALVLLLPHTLVAEKVSFASTNRQIALLELYTSEGCSSCPPADRWLGSLQENDGLWQNFIPIALHVDYWDYIGWKDRFASPENSARQRRYARERSLKTVYTPGFIYNGKEWRNWFVKPFMDFPEGGKPGILKLQIENQHANINFIPTKPTRESLQVNLALLGFDLATEIKAGENKGKKLPHDFVVLAINRAQLKAGKNQYKTRLDLPTSKIKTSRYGIVAWINARDIQVPVQSVGGWLP